MENAAEVAAAAVDNTNYAEVFKEKPEGAK